MWLWDWLVQDDTLTGKLRAFSVRHVKISEEDMTRTRKLVKDYIEDRIMAYCRQNSELPILNLQYTGSVYERLKTEAADEVDVMVVLKTSKQASQATCDSKQPWTRNFADMLVQRGT